MRRSGRGARGSRIRAELDIQRGDGHVDRELVVLSDFAKNFEVAHDQIRFGDNAQLEAAMAGELFENAAGDFVAALGGLVGIGGGAEGDGFSLFSRGAGRAAAGPRCAA
jgi:hypothetical protein